MNIDLKKLKTQIPFLKKIPNEIYYELNTDNFVIPNDFTKKLIRILEKKLNGYVMVYSFKKDLKKDAKKELCEYYSQAKLGKKEIILLKTYEKILKKYDVSLCVYEKPLKLL